MWRKAPEYEVNMATTNPITGDRLQTKPASEDYLSNYDRIFRQNKESKPIEDSQKDIQNGSEITQDASGRCKNKD
jgi:hypothetical protein